MTLKQLTWRLIFPLTIILFGTVTKWWYVLPVDAPDTMMIGFPFPFVADGWFTSMSIQIFVFEFILDFVIYFLFLFLITLLIRRFLTHLSIIKPLKRIVWTLATLTTTFWFVFFSISEKDIVMRRGWDMQVLVTGYKSTWTHQDRPDLKMFDRNKK